MTRAAGSRAAHGAIFLALVFAVGCLADNREEMVRDALVQANMPEVAVDIDDDGRIVRLTGTVETLADRRRAEEIATAIVGTTGRVRNEVSVPGIDDHSGNQ